MKTQTPSMKANESMKAQSTTMKTQTHSMKANENIKTQSNTSTQYENPRKRKHIPILSNVVIHELHLPNRVTSSPGTYSCAIDSFIDHFYHSLFTLLDRNYVTSPFLISLLTICDKYKELKTLHRDRVYKNSELKFSRKLFLILETT